MSKMVNIVKTNILGEDLLLRRVTLPPNLSRCGEISLKLCLTVLNLIPLISVLVMSFIERDTTRVCAFRPWTHGYIDCVSMEELGVIREHRYTSILLGPLVSVVYKPDLRCYKGVLTADHEFMSQPEGEATESGLMVDGIWSYDKNVRLHLKEYYKDSYCVIDAYSHSNQSLVRFIEILILIFILSITAFSALSESDIKLHSLLLFVINVTMLGVCLSTSLYIISLLLYKIVLFVCVKLGKIDDSVELDTLVTYPPKASPN